MATKSMTTTMLIYSLKTCFYTKKCESCPSNLTDVGQNCSEYVKIIAADALENQAKEIADLKSRLEEIKGLLWQERIARDLSAE